jgi:hypothetical protein
MTAAERAALQAATDRAADAIESLAENRRSPAYKNLAAFIDLVATSTEEAAATQRNRPGETP